MESELTSKNSCNRIYYIHRSYSKERLEKKKRIKFVYSLLVKVFIVFIE